MMQLLPAKSRLRLVGSLAILPLIALSGLATASDELSSKAEIGLAIAPVPLNLVDKDRELVGLGSYIVNGQSGCNDCHSPSPAVEYSAGGNPFFGQPKTINPAVYLVWVPETLTTNFRKF